MTRSPSASGWAEKARFGIFSALLIACFLFGGASRLDVPPLILLQPFAVLCTAAFLLLPGPVRWHEVQVPLLALAGLAGVMLAQLVPLPPAIWTALPGQAPFIDTAAVAGIEQPWRPISLTPDLTLASLAGMIVPLAVLIGLASVSRERSFALIPGLVIGTVLSIVLGLAQIAGGERSAFYLYQVSSFATPVGFFANRNHQAVLLAMAIPIIAVWINFPRESDRYALLRYGIATSLILLLVPVLAITGSRAGLALAVLGAFFAVNQARMAPIPISTAHRRVLVGIAAGGLALCAALLAILIAQGRDEAIRRTITTALEEESRLRFVPTMLEMLRDFFPFGSGFGSFDPVFRFYEPYELLKPTYLNHAHNDLLELGITGGLPALFVAGLFCWWIARRGFEAFRTRRTSRTVRAARLGAAMVLMMLLSSLVDYPLRTPLLSALFAIAAYWVAREDRPTRDDEVAER